jgi:hypothetical protein
MMVTAAVAVATWAALSPRAALAQGRGHVPHGHVVVGAPFYGYGWGSFYGPFWSPFYGPWGWGYGHDYAPYGGVDLNAAAIAGVAGVDLNVKPNSADVWVDGRFAAEARDLDGSPRYLWLRDGTHRVVIYKEGYKNFDEEIDVQAGSFKTLKVRLEPGQAEAPGRKPGKGDKVKTSEPNAKQTNGE